MHDYENFIYILDNKKIHLTVLENEILKILIENKRTVVTYENVSQRLHDTKYDKYIKASISNLIYKLRKKGINITTKKGFGYMII